MSKIIVFASGTGTNFKAICEKHKVSALFVDKDCRAIDIAKTNGIEVYNFKAKWKQIISKLDEINPDLIILAGFMRILPKEFVAKYFLKIINIHPSLLPKHPGLHGIKDSYDSRDKFGGVTVHFVDHGMDTGHIIAQEKLEIKGTMEEYEAEIHKIEHKLYPKVIGDLLKNPFEYIVISKCLLGEKVRYDGEHKYSEAVDKFISNNNYKLISVCPEVEAGFSIPRITMDIIDNKLISKDGKDLTNKLEDGIKKTLLLLKNKRAIAIMKENSPSCGLKEQYGLFTKHLIEDFDIPVFTEEFFEELFNITIWYNW